MYLEAGYKPGIQVTFTFIWDWNVHCLYGNKTCNISHVQELLQVYIKTPSEDEFKVIIQGFCDYWGFPQCGGGIDGTHMVFYVHPTALQTTITVKAFIQSFYKG